MTIQQAIRIMSEEAERYRQVAKELSEDPIDCEGRSLRHARRYNEKAEAAETLIRAARKNDQEENK